MENVKGAALKKASSDKKGAKSSFRRNHNFPIFITFQCSTLLSFANSHTIIRSVVSMYKAFLVIRRSNHFLENMSCSFRSKGYYTALSEI